MRPEDKQKMQNEIMIAEKAYLRYIKRLMIFAADDAKKNILQNRSYATNALKESISGNAKLDNNVITGSFGANTKYAEGIEIGTLPGRFPPVQSIVDWLERKISLGHMQQGNNTLSNMAMSICIAIKNKGTKAKPYLQPAFEKMIKRFEENIPLRLENG